ncbi:MAG: SDR family oxidoreductase [Nitriliruptoraceae bacterium]
MADHHRFAGTRVLVTGASSGIGAAIARGFAAAGASVAVHYHRNASGAQAVVEEAEALGAPQALAVAGDFTEPDAPVAVVRTAVDTLGGLDVLVNNAGELIARVDIDTVDDATLDAIVQLNFLSVVRACREAMPAIRASTGSIINTTSVTAETGASGGAGLYAAAKGGVNSLTRSMAKDLAADGIRVNAISPGIVHTPLQDRHTSEAGLVERVGRIPMGRLGAPEDFVAAALFLADPAASGFMTGQVLEINGGMYFG